MFHFTMCVNIRPANIPVSGQLGENSGELPFTQNFFAAQFFFFFYGFFQIFFLIVSLCGIKHIVNIDSYSINISSRSRVEVGVFSS